MLEQGLKIQEGQSAEERFNRNTKLFLDCSAESQDELSGLGRLLTVVVIYCTKHCNAVGTI